MRFVVGFLLGLALGVALGALLLPRLQEEQRRREAFPPPGPGR
ncbi:MAG TPA: hypothetical protein VNL95_09315 [Dehalococcoidia bacterium]|nr:hypothetical protein [Dehalococcoidia bacterium]